jgi:arylsulfatase A-like enzyme
LPLRAGKGWLYEGGIRVPLVIVAPGMPNAGSVSDTPLITCDFFPTLLELAGLNPQPRAHLDGTSFAALITDNKQPPPRTFYWHYPHYHGSTWTPGGALREGEWKLVEFFEQNQAEIYNLKNDPGEQKDLSASEPVRKQELLEKLHRWQRSVDPRIPGPSTASDTGQNQRVRKQRNK